MNVPSNETATGSDVLVWLNGIVEAFDDGGHKSPIKTADHSRYPLCFPGDSKVDRDNGDMFYNSCLSYSTASK